MQFVKHGPDIPEQLLEAHEEGRVVFFCGAGISYPAGLPLFSGLVDQIYATLGTHPNNIEKETLDRKQYDATLDLLEHRVVGGRMAVRTALFQVLTPRLRRKGATDTHTALLQLARSRDEAIRLVTTNFDRIFQRVISRTSPAISHYPAPLLPIPKNSRWDGVVYLHGLLPEKIDEGALNRLVLTSGDFGLAYLTERWAARFVSELFRNYVVCFVGYSINDPVLRYMMDALAADRMLGEFTPQAYALGEFQATQQEQKRTEWVAKGVVPILYEVPGGTHNHSALHGTLKSWAETYRDGVQGRERIVLEYALAKPLASTIQDDFVGRMLWALSHASGLPARRFADFNPAPSLDWLQALTDTRYRHADLARFGVVPNVSPDNKIAFSLLRRPAPYTHAPWMNIAGPGDASRWDDVMAHLARWLLRHLDDPSLVLWLAQFGGEMHEQFAWLLESRLDHLSRLERDGKTEELEHIRATAPNGIPRPAMRTLWRLLLTRRLKSRSSRLDLYRWKDQVIRDGLTAVLRLELRHLLAPRVSMQPPLRPRDDRAEVAPTRLRDVVNWDLVLSTDDAHAFFREVEQNIHSWRSHLPTLLEDFQQLLRDALDLLRELGDADDLTDRSHWDLPSIIPHWQNRGFSEWVVLIELVRDSWLVTRERDAARARRVAEDWWLIPYPTFKRMALFAATFATVLPEAQWVEWLLSDDAWWLWALDTRREAIRLLVLRGGHVAPAERERLDMAILAGPPRRMFRPDIEPGDWAALVDHAIWLRLAKLSSSGSTLQGAAAAALVSISTAHPEWALAADESDEFSHWMTGTGDPGFRRLHEVERAPRHARELVKWLRREQPHHGFHEDDWREVCRDKFGSAMSALCALAQENAWPAERWREALGAWSDDKLVKQSWRYSAPLLLRMPDQVLLAIANSATWWLEAAAKVVDPHDTRLIPLCRRFLALQHESTSGGDEPVTQAINHPVGHITQGLLHHWFARQPTDAQGISEDFRSTFTDLCDIRVDQYRHGRVLLAAHVIALLRVDREWTSAHVLPLFRWQGSSVEARAAWEGFLWSPRLYRPLFAAFKADFLATAGHYGDLGAHGRQYAAMFTYAALDPGDTFTMHELAEAASALTGEGLTEAAYALVNALDGADNQREEQWTNRIRPFWRTVWPKSRNLISQRLAQALAEVCIAARGEFPGALATVREWLIPVEGPHHIVHLLWESGICTRFPKEALDLLHAIISAQPWPPAQLGDCLKAIAAAYPDAAHDQRYRRLAEYARQHGQQA